MRTILQNQIRISEGLVVLGFTVLIASAFMMLTPTQVLGIPMGEWTNRSPTTAPEPRTHSPLAFHLNSGLVILYGGFNATFSHLGDTWAYEYSANTWTNRAPSSSPPPTGGHYLSYDWDFQQVIFFGGHLSGAHASIVTFHETWAYNYTTNTWTNRTTASHPPGSAWGDMTYIVQAERQLLFGGLGDGAALLDDTWTYDYETNTWANRAPSANPPARFDHRMVYDSESDKVILVGGIGLGGNVLDDVWAYDYTSNTWTERASLPSDLCSQGLAYDNGMDRVILFGGTRDFDETNLSDETWIYDFNTDTWEQLTPSPHPPGTCRAYMTYDDRAQRSILFGGRGTSPSPVHFEETWAFRYFDTTTDGGVVPGFPAVAILFGIALSLGITIITRRKRH